MILGPESLNTHFFDGKMSAVISSIQPEIDRVQSLSQTEKSKGFAELEAKLRASSDIGSYPNALRCFSAIASDFASGRRGNYDSANKLNAEDLLYLLYEKIVLEKNEEYENLTLVQLDEMISGLSPQGRTTRLLQVLVMLGP